MALHNLGWFYVMLSTILVDILFAMITAVFALVYCGINIIVSSVTFGFVVVGAIIVFGAGGYLAFSILQLV